MPVQRAACSQPGVKDKPCFFAVWMLDVGVLVGEHELVVDGEERSARCRYCRFCDALAKPLHANNEEAETTLLPKQPAVLPHSNLQRRKLVIWIGQ